MDEHQQPSEASPEPQEPEPSTTSAPPSPDSTQTSLSPSSEPSPAASAEQETTAPSQPEESPKPAKRLRAGSEAAPSRTSQPPLESLQTLQPYEESNRSGAAALLVCLADKKAISIPYIHLIAALQAGQRVLVYSAIADLEITFQAVSEARIFIEAFNALKIHRINHNPPEISVTVRVTMPEPKEQDF
jgi:hypothetical protein